MEDKRRFPRVPLNRRLLCALDNVNSTEAPARDFSAGGVSFYPAFAYPLNARVLISMSLKQGSHTIALQGRVVRVWKENGKDCCAVEFVDVSPERARELTEFVETLPDE